MSAPVREGQRVFKALTNIPEAGIMAGDTLVVTEGSDRMLVARAVYFGESFLADSRLTLARDNRRESPRPRLTAIRGGLA